MISASRGRLALPFIACIVAIIASALLPTPAGAVGAPPPTTLSVTVNNAPTGGALVTTVGSTKISCPSTCAASYSQTCTGGSPCQDWEVATVTLTAQSFSGWSVAWSGHPTCSTTCAVLADESISVTYADSVDPTVTLTAPADGARMTGHFAMSANASDNGPGAPQVRFYVRGVQMGVASSAPYGVTIDGIADGTAELKAVAVGANGRASAASVRQVIIDNSGPTGSITTGQKLVKLGSTLTADFNFSDPAGVATVSCAITSYGQQPAYQPCGSLTSFTSSVRTVVGRFTLYVRATDNLGNDSQALIRTFDVSADGPGIVGFTPALPMGVAAAPTQPYTWNLDEPGTSWCAAQAPGAPKPAYTRCADTFMFAPTISGTWTLWFKTVDPYGNFTEGHYTYEVDMTAPTTTITSGPAEGSTLAPGTVSFAFTTSEAATLDCRSWVTGAPEPAWGPCSGPAMHTITSPPLGAYVLQVRARDTVGNIGATVERHFTVASGDPGPSTGTGGASSPPNTGTPGASANAAGPTTPPSCVVPKLVGATLATAKKRIVAAHCRLGKVTKVRKLHAKHGIVIKQLRKRGAKLPSGTKIALSVTA